MSLADKEYMDGRRQYGSEQNNTGRPQALIWADNPPTVQDGKLRPVGYEIGVNTANIQTSSLTNNRFLILSDHNRSELGMTIERIEQKRRMVNGTMRSYHVADKTSISVDWDMLPSRSFKNYPSFDELGKPNLQTLNDRGEPIVSSGSLYAGDQKYTVDGGAGGVELLDWYETHKGPFWVMLSYDKYNAFQGSGSERLRLAQYSQVLQMYISSFNYSIVKRGGNNFDMWNISVQLEEV